MTQLFAFFFRDVLGQKVIDSNGHTLGRLKDFLADTKTMRPTVVGAQLQTNEGVQTLYFSQCRPLHHRGRGPLMIENPSADGRTPASALWLASDVLDKQVVDIDNKRLVRVNDLRIAILETGVSVAAVDDSTKGRLRKYGLETAVEHVWAFFGVTLPTHMILWENIETLDQTTQTGTAQAGAPSVLERFHPSDVADIIEKLDPTAQAQVFSAMDMERAADVLEEIESDTRETLLESLPPEKMADVLERMPADEVADILDEVDDHTAEELLREMDGEASDEVMGLMHYAPDVVGSLMSTDYLCFTAKDSVGKVLEMLRHEKPQADVIYDLFVIMEGGELEATVTLRDIAVSDPTAALSDIMNRDAVFVRDTDPVDRLSDLIAKYNLLSVPVVNAEKALVGVAIINDVLDTLLKPKRRK